MSVQLSRRAAALGVLAAAAVIVMAAPAVAAPPFGTSPVSGAGFGGTGPGKQVTIQSVTVGHHSAFDRVVITTANGLPSYTVRYVPELTNDPKGTPVSLLGTAFLEVTLRNTAWTTAPSPQPTITPGFPALKQLKGAGEFEAVAHYGIGQATKAGFRVFTLTGPNRLVIDLAAPPAAATPATGAAATGTGTGIGTKSGAESGGAASGSPALPTTGFPTRAVAGLGLGLLLAGAAALTVLRRRRVLG